MQAADLSTNQDEIIFDLDPVIDGTTIQLTQGQISIANPVIIDGLSQGPDGVTIVADDPDTQVDGNGSRIFNIEISPNGGDGVIPFAVAA
ncbi:MAG: hypothetical protein AAGA92_03490 [Planctomycetota bacterium]